MHFNSDSNQLTVAFAQTTSRSGSSFLRGKLKDATSLRITDRFPIFLTRDLIVARAKLKAEDLGHSRFGLTGSSVQLDFAPKV
jgi:hypothetical protein